MRLSLISASSLGLAAALVLGLGTPAHAATETFREDFNTTAAVGSVDAVYKNSWQPYPNGMSGKYYSDDILSVHGGNLDAYFGNGRKGFAGTFGTANGAWGAQGGTFSIRAKQVGGASEGIAVMLWPTSDAWGEGEIDFPEGRLNSDVHVFHHFTAPNDPQQSVNYNFGNQWSTWHTYTITWKPGAYVKYSMDGVVKFTVTQNVPSTPHRYMIQSGNEGKGGHLVIDWVETKPL